MTDLFSSRTKVLINSITLDSIMFTKSKMKYLFIVLCHSILDYLPNLKLLLWFLIFFLSVSNKIPPNFKVTEVSFILETGRSTYENMIAHTCLGKIFNYN